MSEQPLSAIGTVAEEAARLIEDMATMARLSHSGGNDPSAPADEPAHGPAAPPPPDQGGSAWDHEARDRSAGGSGRADMPSQDSCSQCGAEHEADPGDPTPLNCRLCPLCRGIGLLRSIRPETVDLLADLALSVAAGLRDVAMRSRAAEPASSAKASSEGPGNPERAPVQDIHVDDESEG
jgi:hypothetical protein